ncbi:Uncharacterized protein FKW44_011650, partial [Caligus rogercresseyi]
TPARRSIEAKRLERCKKVLNYFKKSSVLVKIFSDKKIFTLDTVCNRRNDRYIAKSLDQVECTYLTKHPQQIMMLGVVSMPP